MPGHGSQGRLRHMQLISKRFWPYEMVMVKEVSMLDPNLWRAVMNNDKNWPVAATGFLRRGDAAGGERSPINRRPRRRAQAVRSSLRIRSSASKAECPSFMWQTVGVSPNATSAWRPPMPSTNSCFSRTSRSQPYNWSVVVRSSGRFEPVLVSSRESGTQPHRRPDSGSEVF